MGVELRLPQMHRCRLLRLLGYDLLQFLLQSQHAPPVFLAVWSRKEAQRKGWRTRFSKTHLLSFHSTGRHCHIWWLLLSRHCQWLRNSSRQDLLMSSILLTNGDQQTVDPASPSLSWQPGSSRGHDSKQKQTASTYTLLAHLVTLRPSFRHSNSPFPGFSFLHCM